MVSFLRDSYLFALAFCFCVVHLWADLADETIYLTWQHHPSSTMTIQWVSPSEDRQSVIEYRKKGGEQNWLKVNGESFPFPQAPQFFVHRVELQGLQPETEYQFKLVPSEMQYQFLTASARLEKEFRFVVGGDMYHDTLAIMKKTSQQAALTNPIFALIGGDIAYSVETRRSTHQKIERWIDWIKAWHATMVTPKGNLIPVIAAIGNHDLLGQYDQTQAQGAIFALLFPMPGKRIFNVLDFNAYLSLVILDSGHANPIAGGQTNWLNTILETHQHIPHRFAVYHVPAFPCVRTFYTKQSILIRKHWTPLFEKWGLQVAFEHHDHAYKRTYPILKNQFLPNGVVYIGDGGWGMEHPRFIRHKRSYVAQFASARHFIAVTLSPTSQRFTSINDLGQIIDDYTRFIQ